MCRPCHLRTCILNHNTTPLHLSSLLNLNISPNSTLLSKLPRILQYKINNTPPLLTLLMDTLNKLISTVITHNINNNLMTRISRATIRLSSKLILTMVTLRDTKLPINLLLHSTRCKAIMRQLPISQLKLRLLPLLLPPMAIKADMPLRQWDMLLKHLNLIPRPQLQLRTLINSS